MRYFFLLFLFIIVQCSPISRKSLEKPRLRNGFEYYSASIDSLNKGAYNSALQLVKESIKLNPHYAKFHLLEGDIYYKLENREAAINSYNQATTLRSSSSEAYLRIAKIYELDFKDYNEAIKFYRKAYAAENSSHQILIDIGECYFAQSEITLAENKAEEYKKLVEAENKIPIFEYFYLSGKINFNKHEFNSAITNLQQAIKIKPNHFDSKLLLVKCLFETGKQEDGLRHISALLKVNDKVGELYYYRAIYYFSKSKYEDAIGLFEQALNLDDTLLKSHYYLGKIYDALGDNEKSLHHLQMYRKAMEFN